MNNYSYLTREYFISELYMQNGNALSFRMGQTWVCILAPQFPSYVISESLRRPDEQGHRAE